MTIWRLAIGLVLLLHGVGHALGVLSLAPLDRPGWNMRSWLLTDALGEGVTRILGVALWSLGGLLFIIAGLALLRIVVPEDWWRTLAVTGAIVSLATIALYWNALPFLFPNKVGAIAVDVAVIAGVLIAHWPSDDLLEG
jgi:hypothetical protein